MPLSQKTQIRKPRKAIECFFFISIIVLSLLLQINSLYLRTDPYVNNELKNEEGQKIFEKNEEGVNSLKNNLLLEKQTLENNPIITYQNNYTNDSTFYDKPQRSPASSKGVSQTSFDIREYVTAKSTRINESTANSWGSLTAQQNLTNIGAYDLETPTNKSGTALQFIPGEASLNITDVKAYKELTTIENETSGYVVEQSDKTFGAIAQNFTLPSRTRLDSVWIFLRAQAVGGFSPDMNISVCQDDAGNPGVALAFTHFTDITTLEINWFQVNFSSPPILVEDTKYWIVINQTDAEGKLHYAFLDVITISYYSGMLLYRIGTGWEERNPGSMPLLVQMVLVNGTDHPLSYDDPASCEMIYNGYSLTNFTNIPMNTTEGTNDQIFQTNVSVIFNVTWQAKFQSQDTHETLSLEYSASDMSETANWNISFGCIGVNSTYALSNYNLTWTLVPTDWNPNDMYHGTTDVTSDLTPTKSGRTWSIVNSSVISGISNFTTLTYRLEATSPNYVIEVTTSHTARNLTDSITVTTDFKNEILSNGVSKFNISILFPNSTEVVVNASMTQTTNPQNTIVPLLANYPNGTYRFITTYWNGTEVGFNVSTIVIVYTLTNLTVEVLESSPLIIGEQFNLTVFFNDTVKNQGVSGASEASYQTDSNWGESGNFNDDGNGNYTVSLSTSNKQRGTHWLQVTLEYPFHINQTLNLTVLFVAPTLLSSPDYYPDPIYYTDTIRIWTTFNESDGTTPVEDADVVMTSLSMGIENVPLTDANNGSGIYYVDIQTTGNDTINHNFNITANKTNYQTQTQLFSLDILENPTSLVATDTSGILTNKSIVAPLYFNASYTVEFQYTDAQHILPIDESPSVQFSAGAPLKHTTGTDGSNKTVTFDLNDTGSHTIIISFPPSLGYSSQTFNLTLDIFLAFTSTSGQSGSQEMAFNSIYNFWIQYWDDSNGKGIGDANVTIEGLTIFDGYTGSGNYTFYFDFSLSQVGTFSVNITFSKTSYVSQTVYLTFKVLPVTTSLTGTLDDGTLISNETTILIYYGNAFGLNLTWFDMNHSVGIVTAPISEEVNSSTIPTLWITKTYPDAGSYDYYISPDDETYFGFWVIVIVLESYGHQNKSWVLNVRVAPRPTSLTITLANGTTLPNSTDLHFLVEQNITFHLEWTDVNSSTTVSSPTVVPDSNPIGALTKISNYDFNVSSSPEGLLPRSVIVTITYSKEGYVGQVYYAIFVIHGRSTSVAGQTSANISLGFGETYSFWIEYNDTGENKRITNATVEIEGILTFLGGNNTGNYTFLFDRSLVELGNFSVTITIRRLGYDHQDITLDIQVSVLETNPLELLANSSSTILADYNFSLLFWWSDIYNRNISDATIRVFVNGNETTEFWQETSIANDLYNITLSTITLDWGIYDISLQFSKDGYQERNYSIQLTLLPHIVIEVLDDYPESVDVGQNIIVQIQFKDENATEAALEELNFDSDWRYSWERDENNSDVETGFYQFIFYTSETYPGTYNVQLNYNGFQTKEGSYLLTFEVKGSFSTTDLGDVDQYVNETAFFSFTIRDQFNIPVSNLSVSWELLNSSKSGIANFTSEAYWIEIDCTSLQTITYVIQLNASRAYYDPFYAQANLTVLPKTVTNLTWVDLPQNFSLGETITLKVHLTFENGTDIAGQMIYFVIIIEYAGTLPDINEGPSSNRLSLYFLLSKSTETFYRSALTDSAGIASININAEDTRNAIRLVSAEVSYPGTEGYKAFNLSLDTDDGIPFISDITGDQNNGVDIFSVIFLIIIVIVVVAGGFLFARRYEKMAFLTSRKEEQAYQELNEIAGMRHLLISTRAGIGIYSETFFKQVSTDTSPMLAGLITALDSFVHELSEQESEFSQLVRSGFNLTSRLGKYTQITLISESSSTSVTRERLRRVQEVIEDTYREVLELNVISLVKFPKEEVRATIEKYLHTDLLYGLSVDEEQMVEQWEELNKTERKTIEAARRAIQLTEHNLLYINSWVSEMRGLKIPEAKILKNIYTVTERKIVYVSDRRDIGAPVE